MKLKPLFFFLVVLLTAGHSYAQHPADTTARLPLKAFDKTSTLFELRDEQLDNKNRSLRFYALSGYREGVAPIKGTFASNFLVQRDEVKGTYQLKMYNLSIQDMLTHGLRKSGRVILEVKDPSRYRYDPKYGPEKEWLRQHAYCFELLMPLGAVDGMGGIDALLCGLFKVKIHTEKRLVNTLVLVRTSDQLKFKTAGGEMIRDYAHGIYRNAPMAALGGNWYEHGTLPFKDETGYREPVDIGLNVAVKSMDDLPAFRQALKKYDLDLREEMREMDMFVITELN